MVRLFKLVFQLFDISCALYAIVQMTWDPETNTSMYTEPQLTTPMVSPPLSPKLDPALLPPGTRMLRSAGNSGACLQCCFDGSDLQLLEGWCTLPKEWP